jgi:hypothetical protein
MKLLDSIKEGTDSLNENKYFFGVVMIMLNIGARFIIDELKDEHRQYINNQFIRRVFIFCAFFMSTKDVCKAFFLTVIFIVLLNEVFTEELEEMDTKDTTKEKGTSYNKTELDKVIDKLKVVHRNL